MGLPGTPGLHLWGHCMRGVREQADARGPGQELLLVSQSSEGQRETPVPGLCVGEAAFPSSALELEASCCLGMCVILNSSRFFLIDFLSLKNIFLYKHYMCSLILKKSVASCRK